MQRKPNVLDVSLNTQNKFNSQSLTRKTKQVREIKLLQEKAPTYGTKIEDIHMAKPLHIETLATKALENLFFFLEINEGDNATKIFDKLHQKRLEIAGQKPTKMKMEDLKKLNNLNNQ